MWKRDVLIIDWGKLEAIQNIQEMRGGLVKVGEKGEEGERTYGIGKTKRESNKVGHSFL